MYDIAHPISIIAIYIFKIFCLSFLTQHQILVAELPCQVTNLVDGGRMSILGEAIEEKIIISQSGEFQTVEGDRHSHFICKESKNSS